MPSFFISGNIALVYRATPGLSRLISAQLNDHRSTNSLKYRTHKRGKKQIYNHRFISLLFINLIPGPSPDREGTKRQVEVLNSPSLIGGHEAKRSRGAANGLGDEVIMQMLKSEIKGAKLKINN
jgi:hypothetical protein